MGMVFRKERAWEKPRKKAFVSLFAFVSSFTIVAFARAYSGSADDNFLEDSEAFKAKLDKEADLFDFSSWGAEEVYYVALLFLISSFISTLFYTGKATAKWVKYRNTIP